MNTQTRTVPTAEGILDEVFIVIETKYKYKFRFKTKGETKKSGFHVSYKLTEDNFNLRKDLLYSAVQRLTFDIPSLVSMSALEGYTYKKVESIIINWKIENNEVILVIAYEY